MWDRIDRRAAFDLANVIGSAGIRRHPRVDEANRATNERVNRIGDAEIGPAVSARSSNHHFYATGGQSFGRNVVDARSVEHNHSLQSVAVRVNKCAHAAQVSFAFFTNVGNKQNRSLRPDARFVNRPRDSYQRREPGTVIRNSRGRHTIFCAMNLNIRTSGKDGIEVR